MRQAAKYVQNFDFRSDFGAQAPPVDPADDKVAVSAEDLAALLQEARATGMAEAEARYAASTDNRLETATAHLNDALASLVALAGHLEACARDGAQTDTALALIQAAARRIIDGQGDLFAGRKEFADSIAQ